MITRRKFIGAAVAGTAATATAAPAAKAPVEIRYSASPPPPKTGPHTGTLDVLIQKLKPGPDLPLSFLHRDHTDAAAWKAKARARMLELMYYRPEPCDPRPETLSRQDCGDYIREEVMFNTTPVFRVPATILIPKRVKLPAPGVVALHSHGGYYLWGREREIEEENTHPTLLEMRNQGYGGKATSTEMVRRGFVVIAIDMFYWGERRMILDDSPEAWKKRPAGIGNEEVLRMNRLASASEQLMGRTLFSAGTTWAGLIAWDDIRTVDYFVTRPEVDPRRIGCVGHSVGGVRSAYLAALDDRIRAAVVCGWMCSFPYQLAKNIRSTIGFTKLIPGIYSQLDHPDLAAIALPTPLMVISGKQDPLFNFDGVQIAHDKIARCYAKAGLPDRFRSHIEDRPHEFSGERQAGAWAWFDRWLRAPASPG